MSTNSITCGCGQAFTHHLGEGSTLVGYHSPDGHNHDDNCKSRTYVCPAGHATRLSRRNRCPACDWKGKESCFCHRGEKIDEWPDAPYQESNKYDYISGGIYRKVDK